MRISYTPEQEELRRELRSYFTTLMTPERREALSSTQGEVGTGNAYRDTVAQMGKDGKWQLNLFDPNLSRIELMEFKPVEKPCCSEFTGPHPSE